MDNKLYTLPEAYEAANIGDLIFYSGNLDVYRFKNYQFNKSDIISDSASLPLELAILKEWQIKRAEPRVLSTREIADKNFIYGGPMKEIVYDAISQADKNGQLREFYRPEQVELRDAVKILLNNHFGWNVDAVSQKKIQLLEHCFNNLKPPTTE